MTELQTRFPITFAKCQDIKQYKNKKYQPNIITNMGITYDKSVIPIITDDEIEHFIQLQIKYPEIINNCFSHLIELLEEQEKQQNQIIKTSLKYAQNKHMNKMYELLMNTNEYKDNNNIHNLEMIDKWVLFIKSQNEFCKFF